MRVTIFNEHYHDLHNEKVQALYPDGLHAAVAAPLIAVGHQVRFGLGDAPESGLPQSLLDDTDVLFWWGHVRHQDVSDEVVQRVAERVWDGMGIVFLHSAHASKPMQRLLGTPSQKLRWREIGESERLWVVKPGHPLAQGVGEFIDIDHEEMYGEVFHIPEPEELIFISWFAGGEVFRSGCCWTRGQGRIFYFRPGHETLPTYYHEGVKKVLVNAAEWCAARPSAHVSTGHMPTPMENVTLKP